MTNRITVYTFEDRGGDSAPYPILKDFREAMDYARWHGYTLIAKTYDLVSVKVVDPYDEEG